MVPSMLSLALAATLAAPVQEQPGLETDGAEPAAARAPRAAGVEYAGAAGDLTVATPAVAEADISVDGRLDEAAWLDAAVLHSFTQYDPVEGVSASQATEVLVLVDEDAIYFGVKAYDDIDQVRATLAQRDRFTRSDDFVRIMLDTFNDQRRAYVFSVNPKGVQHDGIWNEGGSSSRGFGPPIDDNPNFIWDSDATMADWGYALELRIPFKSLRFPEVPVQDWGIQVVRRIQRTGFESSWAPMTQNVANFLTQSGKLAGLRDLDPGLFMEINPALTGTRFGGEDDVTGAFGHDSPTGEFGVNLTYGVTSNLTLDATINPDFSQVEADAGQISVNERFAIFFPEQRPFFLEGTEIFEMPKQIVYTRSIANPIAGAKLTGKVGSLQLGYLGAMDQSFDAGEPNTLANLVRLRQDVGSASTVGAIYTDRTVASDDYNRVVGTDARFVMGGRYTLTLLGAGSWTAEPGTEGTGAVTGRLLNAQFQRAGRNFSYSAEFEDSNDTFEPGSGFFRRVGFTQLESNVNFGWWGPSGSLLESINPNLQMRAWWEHDDFWAGRGLQEAQVQVGGRVGFRGNITFFGNHQRRFFRFAPEDYDGLFFGTGPDALNPFRPDQSLFENLGSTTVGMWVSTWRRVRGNVRMTFGRTPIFDRSRGVAVEPVRSFNMDAGMTLFLTQSLRTELGLRHSTLTRDDGTQFSSATIPRFRAQYQFTRALFVRTILEYGTQEQGALRDPVSGLPLFGCRGDSCSLRDGSDNHDIHVEGLVTYEPSPGTVFYVGYTRDMRDTQAFGFQDMEPVADGLFVKLSYRFRM